MFSSRSRVFFTMASRKNRTRNTADKMAAYKAAASKNLRVTGSGSSPRNSSNRSTPTRTSPRSSSRISKNSSTNSPKHVKSLQGGTNKQPSSSQSPQKPDDSFEVAVVLNQHEPRSKLAVLEKGQDAVKNSNKTDTNTEEIEFGPDDVIPETPPRAPATGIRKRIIAPLRSKVPPLSVEIEDGRPTKKRRVFNTPPKKNCRAAEALDMCGEGASHHHSPQANMRGLCSQDYDSHRMAGDDLVMSPPSSGSAQNVPCPREKRFQISVFNRNDRSLRDHNHVEEVGAEDRIDHAKRFVGDDMALDLITTSTATLSRIFDGLSRKISKDIEDMRRIHLSEIRRMGDSLNETMASEIRTIHGLYEMLTGVGKHAGRVPSSVTTSLRDWERKLDGLTPYTTVIFGKDLFSRVLSFNVPLKAVDTYQKYGKRGVTDVERCSLSAQTLLFRLQPADKKFQYLEDIGKLHSDFKFSVVRNAFYNVHLDSFGFFKSVGCARNEDVGIQDDQTLRIQRGKIDRPSWLEKGTVTIDHIVEARAFTETPGQSRKGKARRAPTTDDIACHGALRVYRQLGKLLHDGRSNLRVAFFQGLGYLLVPWEGRSAEIDQCTMNIVFCDDDEPHTGLDLVLDEIPYAMQCAQNADPNTVSTVDASNKKLVMDLFSQWRDMILSVDHDVLVSYPGQRKTAQSGPQRKSLHRLVNLIDVALDCCVEFCRAGSRECFLRSNKNSLRCVMIFAVLFKSICIEFMAKCESNSAVTSFPEPTDVKVHGTCLKDLIPGLSTQKSILIHKCLQLSSSVYETLNHVGDHDDSFANDDDGVGTILDLRTIEESAEDGVMAI